MSVIHLNIDSYLNNQYDVELILNKSDPDIFALSETNLNEFFPSSSIMHNKFNIIRRDQPSSCNAAGGIIIFIKKSLTIILSKIFEDHEAIYLKIKKGKHLMNYIIFTEILLKMKINFWII